jgi:hypothetical protein
MTRMNSVRRFAFAIATSVVVLATMPVSAQEISADHLKAARAAVAAIKATDPFDNILPEGAAALKEQLINKNPDMQEVISQVVDEKALALAPRRADLEKEAAMAYAKAFSIDELNAIAVFYTSEPGKKLLENGPLVLRDVANAAQIWQNGVARDLAQEVMKDLDTKMPKPPAGAGTPPTPEAPAAGGEQPAEPAN